MFRLRLFQPRKAQRETQGACEVDMSLTGKGPRIERFGDIAEVIPLPNLT